MSHKRAQRPHPRLQWHHQPLTALATSSASLAAVAVSAAVSSQNTEHPVFHRPHPIQPHLTLQASLPSANPFSPTHHTKGVTEIIPHLYISDLSFAENPACLSSHRITHILSALPEAIYVPPATLLHPHPPPTRLQIRVEDFPFAELAVHLPRTTEWIGDALTRDPNARVLVHLDGRRVRPSSLSRISEGPQNLTLGLFSSSTSMRGIRWAGCVDEEHTRRSGLLEPPPVADARHSLLAAQLATIQHLNSFQKPSAQQYHLASKRLLCTLLKPQLCMPFISPTASFSSLLLSGSHTQGFEFQGTLSSWDFGDHFF